MSFFIIIIVIIIAIASLIVSTAFYRKIAVDKKVKQAEESAVKIVEDAKTQVDKIISEGRLQAKDMAIKVRDEFQKEAKSRREELAGVERRLIQREEHLDKRVSGLEAKEDQMNKEKEQTQNARRKLDAVIQQQLDALEKTAQMTRDEAKNQLLSRIESEVKQKAAEMIMEVEGRAKETAERRSREVMAMALQKCTVDQALEITTSAIQLEDDDLKGRIIGREGRNIRAFEAATGVDLIVDDTPGSVVLSCFDPIRRQIAKMALEKLLTDGRIHPARVEELVRKAKEEIEERIRETGERTVLELEIGKMNPKLVYLIGKLQFRTSYGQNILQHTIEVARLAALMAEEVGANVRLAKRAGLLHDIGKALDFEQDGTHTRLGVDIAQKCNEPAEVINAILSHHDEVEPTCIESILVKVADALSASRLGARLESAENYLKRIKRLEALVNAFDGVEQSFAIQAGREVRVIVKPDRVDDAGAAKLAYDISRRIEQELEYPGQIKVSVIREVRAMDTAK